MESDELKKASAVSAFMSQEVMPIIIKNCSTDSKEKAQKMDSLHQTILSKSKKLISYGKKLSENGFEKMSADEIKLRIEKAIEQAEKMSANGSEHQAEFCQGQLEMLEIQATL
ncbi:MAG: hypothetical protein OQJ89_13885 [Kangiellaceae bacterium]|nr:hypothetical protein [Kangiellaceae bacterium]